MNIQSSSSHIVTKGYCLTIHWLIILSSHMQQLDQTYWATEKEKLQEKKNCKDNDIFKYIYYLPIMYQIWFRLEARSTKYI